MSVRERKGAAACRLHLDTGKRDTSDLFVYWKPRIQHEPRTTAYTLG